MQGIWADHASLFLIVIGVLIPVAFGIPMALWPLKWARALRWQLPEHTDLAVYLGRSLGSVASVIGAFSIVASRNPNVQGFYFAFLISCWLLMVLVHIYGAIRRIQPLIESLEIVFWSALALLTLACWPTIPA